MCRTGTATSSSIEVRGLSFDWDDGASALQHVDLSVFAGEHVVLVGESGGGKSTLLSLMAGMAEPSSGEILIGGVTRTAAERRAMCAVVRQSAFLVHGHLGGKPPDRPSRRHR